MLTTENAYSSPVPVLKGKTGGDSLPEGWTGFETDFGIESEILDPISIFPWESIQRVDWRPRDGRLCACGRYRNEAG